QLTVPSHITNDGFRADSQLMPGALHLRTSFTGGFADHGKLAGGIFEKDSRMVEFETRADQISRLFEQFIQVKRTTDVPRDLRGRFEVQRDATTFLQDTNIVYRAGYLAGHGLDELQIIFVEGM